MSKPPNEREREGLETLTLTSTSRRSGSLGHILWCLFLGAGTAAYVAAQPAEFWTGDEGRFLYEAKRVLEGQVPYRDFFDFVPPGIMYAMAALFAVFGTDIATAKLAMAVLQGLFVAMIFLMARNLGVRSGLAAAAALAHPALCYSIWPYLSPHWLGAFLMMVATWLLIRGPGAHPVRWSLGLGLLVGLLALVHQHRGAVLGAGVGGLMLLDHFVSGRSRLGVAPLARDFSFFLAGVFIASAPVTLALMAVAGGAAVVDALLIFPLVDYRGFKDNHPSWGEGDWLVGSYTWPHIIKWAVLATAGPAWLALRAWRTRGESEEFRQMVVLVVSSALGVATVFNRLDFVHLAFIAPIFALNAAVTIERMLGLLPEGNSKTLGFAFSLAVCGLLGWQLSQNAGRRAEAFPVLGETEFGLVAFRTKREFATIERLRALYKESDSNDFFCYRACSYVYLMTGTDNPTPHQWLQPGFYRATQFEETIAALEESRVPYVLAPRSHPRDGQKDAILEYLHRHFEPLDQEPAGRKRGNSPFGGQVVIYRRVPPEM